MKAEETVTSRHASNESGAGDHPQLAAPEAALLGRRALLQRGALAGLGIGGALLGGAGCGLVRERAQAITGPEPARYVPLPHDASATAAALHVLNRLAYGPRPGDVAQVAAMGAAGWTSSTAYRTSNCCARRSRPRSCAPSTAATSCARPWRTSGPTTSISTP